MSKYTTGEIAKLCGVSVRTVQYYDSRNILVPSELSEGGRRLYSEQDLKRMKIICFLRDAGISINNIGELLSEDDPGSVISVLLEQQEQALREEVSERQEKLAILDGIKKELRGIDNFSVESIGDIAYAMENKKNMQKLHAILLITGIPLGIMQWTSIILWITIGIWWPFAAYLFVAIPYAVWVSNFYFKRVVYICPQCHEVFKPNLTKYYGKSRGVLELNLSVEQGEVFGFIGPNGAGKSTTIRTLLGLVSPTKGSAQIFGMDTVQD
jgi:DNA-binding transcriptional MerR regulator